MAYFLVGRISVIDFEVHMGNWNNRSILLFDLEIMRHTFLGIPFLLRPIGDEDAGWYRGMPMIVDWQLRLQTPPLDISCDWDQLNICQRYEEWPQSSNQRSSRGFPLGAD